MTATSTFLQPPSARILRRLVGFTRYARAAVGASSASVFLVRTEERDPSLIGVMSDWNWHGTPFAANDMTVSSWRSAESALATGNVIISVREGAIGVEAGWFGTRGIVRAACVPLLLENQRLGVMFFDFDQDARAVDTVYLADVGRRCARALARPAARSYAARWRNKPRPDARPRRHTPR